MWNRGPSLTSLSQIIQSSFKAIYRDQTTIGNSILETMYIFEVKNLIVCQFSKIRKFNNPCDIKSKLGQNWAKKGPNLNTIFQL